MAFSYLQVTKLLNNMLKDVITIHFEQIATEEAVSQIVLNPGRGV